MSILDTVQQFGRQFERTITSTRIKKFTIQTQQIKFQNAQGQGIRQ